jgi:hypothetical protein
MKKVVLEELQNEQMYCLVAPDGSAQLTTLSPDFHTCVAMIKLLHSKGLGQSFHSLCNINGYEVLPVKVTMVQNGTAEDGFQAAKQLLMS